MLELESGIHLLVHVVLYRAAVDISINTDGIKFFGQLPKVKWGPLEIWKPQRQGKPLVQQSDLALSKMESIKNTNELRKVKGRGQASPDGPVLAIELTASKQVGCPLRVLFFLSLCALSLSLSLWSRI